MPNYKRKKLKYKKKEPKNGWWSRMIHKWWIIDREQKGRRYK